MRAVLSHCMEGSKWVSVRTELRVQSVYPAEEKKNG